MARPWIAIPVNQKKAYFSLCIIKYFLDIISPNNDMKAKIDALLSSYPSIDINAMGFLVGGKMNRYGDRHNYTRWARMEKAHPRPLFSQKNSGEEVF